MLFLTETENFQIYYDENAPHGLERAQAIAGVCEDDKAQLDVLFSCQYRSSLVNAGPLWATPGFDKTVVNVLAASANAGARNWGYSPWGGEVIDVYDSFEPAASATPPNATQIRREQARFLFVAELAEIYMGFTGYGWRAAASNGEALSIMVATRLHPLGYYGVPYGPRVTNWLTSPQRNSAAADWISNTEATDKNIVSYGCGLLFLYYLKSQLGYFLQDIIKAGGPTLAATFATLTGKPAGQAITDFRALLDLHVPAGPGPQPPKDDIFPLLSDSDRVVSAYDSSQVVSSWPLPGVRSATLKPGNCPPKPYDYTTADQVVEIDVSASGFGFGSPRFQWSIGGVPIPTDQPTVSITVPAKLTSTAPGEHQAVAITVPIQANVTTLGWNDSRLAFRNDTCPGIFEVDVTVTVDEIAAALDAPTTQVLTLSVEAQSFTLGDDFRRDFARCSPKVVNAVTEAMRQIKRGRIIIKPDPINWREGLADLQPGIELLDRALGDLDRHERQVSLDVADEQLLGELTPGSPRPRQADGAVEFPAWGRFSEEVRESPSERGG
jgi:hypothetical protein